jgi:hypothetical protein
LQYQKYYLKFWEEVPQCLILNFKEREQERERMTPCVSNKKAISPNQILKESYDQNCFSDYPLIDARC